MITILFAIFLHFMTGWMNKGEISLLHLHYFFFKSLSLSTHNGNHFISNINSCLPRDFRFRNPNPKSIFQKITTAWHSSNTAFFLFQRYFLVLDFLFEFCLKKYWEYTLENKFRKIEIKVEKILRGSLDSIPSPSPTVKIQIFGRKVYLR